MTIYSGRSRLLLKVLLWESRGSYVLLYGKVPICPLCSQPIAKFNPCDLHEALLTRRDVMKTQNPDAIMTGLNCVLVHHECHVRLAGKGGTGAFTKCALHLVEHEGYWPVHQWLESMAKESRGVGEQTLKRFESIKELHERLEEYREWYQKHPKSG